MKDEIHNLMVNYYQANLKRFRESYDGAVTIMGQTKNYVDLIPDKLAHEISREKPENMAVAV